MKWKKIYDGYWELIGSGYYMEKNTFGYDGTETGWWVYNHYGIRLAGFENFHTAKAYINEIKKEKTS